MKTTDQVSADKLRGGFYSPEGLVRLCYDRVLALVGSRRSLDVLEPSAGDGAFIRGLAKHPISTRVGSFTAVEINEAEAAKCRATAAAVGVETLVHNGSVLNGVRASLATYDAAVGNPPFVRFQFVSDGDRAGTRLVEQDAGVVLAGVSNLWLPVFLTALTRLRQGGAFAFVIPTECFTGVSASAVRGWLLEHCTDLQTDLFPVGSFPGALQEVLILSGKIGVGDRVLRVVEHEGDRQREWQHTVSADVETWTRFLLTPTEVAAFDEATALANVRRLDTVARFTVATVTGANDFFSLTDDTVDRYALDPWARPLLPRIRYAQGLTFTQEDHERLSILGGPRWMLDTRHAAKDPIRSAKPRSYIEQGEAGNLHLRYKTRIRSPWYQVPVVEPGQILLSKRSHRYPRAIHNNAKVVTTDTIYQGSIRPRQEVSPADFVASFHNSLTLLSTEIEGRSFGGGVLELVPSEIARLVVAVPPGFGEELPVLDALARSSGADSQDLVDETDRLLSKYLRGASSGLLDTLRGARLSLMDRRLARTQSV